ncbi:hypothetical protein N7526_009076 [Penicillium atrosanguineum]|nr:hypothetical protein N7526_009076 [Penicillium atrosanguineum]
MAFKDWGISPMLMFSVGVLVLSAFNYGFSDQAFSTGQAMDSFEHQFGYYDAAKDKWALKPLFKSLYNSCKAGGQIIDIYLGMQMAVIPTALSELAPAKFRGGMGVLYWLSIKCGGLLVTGIARGTENITSNAAWRIPFGLILVIPSIICCAVWFTVEPPRWVSQQLQKRSFKDLFTKENRQRTFVVAACNFFQQATGQAFASQYGTLFVKQLNTINPFSVTLGTNAVDIGAIIISALLIDQVGRRIMFSVSSTMQTVFLMTMGGLGTADSSNIDAKKGIVAMLLLYSFSWSLGWAPLTYVIGAELPSAPLREMTLQIAYTLKLVTEFAVTFSYPYMETADTPGHVYLGGKLGFIYGSISFLAIIFGFLFIPETKRMELEDIDKQFSVPSKDDLKIAENQAYEEETTISEVPK